MKNKLLPIIGILICFFIAFLLNWLLIAVLAIPYLGAAWPIITMLGVGISYVILKSFFPYLTGEINWWQWIIIILIIVIFLVLILK